MLLQIEYRPARVKAESMLVREAISLSKLTWIYYVAEKKFTVNFKTEA